MQTALIFVVEPKHLFPVCSLLKCFMWLNVKRLLHKCTLSKGTIVTDVTVLLISHHLQGMNVPHDRKLKRQPTGQVSVCDSIPSVACLLKNIPFQAYHEGVHVHRCFKHSFQPLHVVSPCVCRWQSHTLQEARGRVWHLGTKDKKKT